VPAPRVAVVLALITLVCGCGTAAHHHAPIPQPAQPVARQVSFVALAPPPAGLALGITEPNPALIAGLGPGPAPPGFAAFRFLTAGLRERYLRIYVDWSKLQPDAAQPPQLDQPQDGCERGVAPCAPYAGVAAQLSAVAALQRERSLDVELVVYGVPSWAARPAGGCEQPGTLPRSRPLTAAGLDGYRALVAALVALARSDGADIAYWSPWNEPNHPYFISPQRDRCDPAAPSLAPQRYVVLADVMAQELRFAAPGSTLVLGELAAFARPSPRATGVGEFVSALPAALVCSSQLWSVHAYVSPGVGGAARAASAVSELEGALDARGCGARAQIWVTETGAGGLHPGGPRSVGGAAERAGCRALAETLAAWSRDGRVRAAFQYTFRDDPRFPVGLADVTLRRVYPAYYEWLAWAPLQDHRAAPPALPAQCA
jgi:hypothetical protein